MNSTQDNNKDLQELLSELPSKVLKNDYQHFAVLHSCIDATKCFAGLDMRVFLELLSQSDLLLEKSAMLIAELCKHDEPRENSTKAMLVPPLVAQLATAGCKSQLQCCRAIANICYENATACAQVPCVPFSSFLNQSVTSADENLQKVLLSCWMNVTSAEEFPHKEAVALGVLDTLSIYLRKYSSDQDVSEKIFDILHSLIEAEDSTSLVGEGDVACRLMRLLPDCRDISSQVLKLLAVLLESDRAKESVAREADSLLSVLRCGRSDVEEKTSDLLILVLTSERAVDLLFGHPENFPKIAEGWLAEGSCHLKTNGALALCNLASSESNSLVLMQTEVVEKIFQNFLQYNPDSLQEAAPLIYACFGVLRNLAIPKKNKALLLERNAIEKSLPYIICEFRQVLFKLLGFLRMMIIGQPSGASKLAAHSDEMLRIIELSGDEDHAGVMGEAGRLITCVFRYADEVGGVEISVRRKSLSVLISLMKSSHVVMQMESVNSLCLLLPSLIADSLEVVVQSSLVSELCTFLQQENLTDHMRHNLLQLATVVASSECLKQKLLEEDVLTVLTEHENFTNDEENKIEKLLSCLRI